jgi:hypothetical protein
MDVNVAIDGLAASVGLGMSGRRRPDTSPGKTSPGNYSNPPVRGMP